jgi:phage tail sheath protein FI
MAILDPAPDSDLEAIQGQRSNFDSKYAALYYPQIIIRDPLYDKDVPIPPSGHIAGIYARSDTERGVWKAPANEVVRGITGLEKTINKGEQDILNPPPYQINVIRDFRTRGRGYRVWGARLITSDSAWKYVPVRRLFMFLEESLDEGLQWVVFEPNDRPLWARVRQSISNFLTTQWRAGALMGNTPEEAFFVQCDETTMTQDDIDNGRLIVLVGVAPVKPAEFVIIRISQKTALAEAQA